MIKWDDILDVLDKYNCKYENARNGGMAEKECSNYFYYSCFVFWIEMASQDIFFYFYYDKTPVDFIKKLVEYAVSYNVNDEIITFLQTIDTWDESLNIRKLLEDYEKAKETLMSIAEDLQKLL